MEIWKWRSVSKVIFLSRVKSIPVAIRELDKIEMARQLDGVYRLDHTVIAKQKAFGLTDANINYRAQEISRRLETGI